MPWAGGASGAYCPFPEPGQKPACLDPARAKYEEVFAALDDGEVADEHIDALEECCLPLVEWIADIAHMGDVDSI